jgi:hypothetical protein
VHPPSALNFNEPLEASIEWGVVPPLDASIVDRPGAPGQGRKDRPVALGQGRGRNPHYMDATRATVPPDKLTASAETV